MSEQKNEEQKLSVEDFAMTPIDIEASKLRKLIEGLRALPNVSDLAVIQTIAELDRIASKFEEIDKKRARILRAAVEAARKKMPEIAESMTSTAEIPQEILDSIAEDLLGAQPVHPTCGCPRCIAKREQAARSGGSSATH